ncbi:MAG: 16S rRNA (cytosine(1402)-N(4))-methyltransferase RsmH [Candidatus Walczuchella monophlebidarum]
MTLNYHTPILINKILDYLIIDPKGTYIDATFGGGGHSRALLKRLEKQGKILAFDQDEEAIQNNIVQDHRLELFHKNFLHIENLLRFKGISKVSGILADLGVSSHQLDTAERGFSMRFDHDIDMRMNKKAKQSAKTIINTYSEEKLYRIFSEFGELKNSRKLAKAIVVKNREKPIETTFEFIKSIENEFDYKKIKFLARVFQALRMEVNGEIKALKQLLISILRILKKGGHVAIISYHSLEDRLVKQFFKNGRFDQTPEEDFYGKKLRPFLVLSNKPIFPSEEEIRKNPRAKSARLRVAEKI